MLEALSLASYQHLQSKGWWLAGCFRLCPCWAAFVILCLFLFLSLSFPFSGIHRAGPGKNMTPTFCKNIPSK